MKFWIARDKSGCLSLFRKKPVWKYSNTLNFEDWFNGDFLALIDPKSFPEITFENSPQEVELKLIKK